MDGRKIDRVLADLWNQFFLQPGPVALRFVEDLPPAVDRIHEVTVVEFHRRTPGGVDLDVVVEPLCEQVDDHGGVESVELEDVLGCRRRGAGRERQDLPVALVCVQRLPKRRFHNIGDRLDHRHDDIVLAHVEGRLCDVVRNVADTVGGNGQDVAIVDAVIDGRTDGCLHPPTVPAHVLLRIE